MREKFTSKGWRIFLIVVLLAAFLIQPANHTQAVSSIRLVIDGKQVDSDSDPININGRTLVPIRVVSEKLGAKVEWDEETRTVSITKGQRNIFLRINNRLVDYSEGQTNYSLSDVAPLIRNSRTFVPLRLVGNALGVEVKWDDRTRTVFVNSNLPPEAPGGYHLSILGIKHNQVISGKTQLQAVVAEGMPSNGAEVKFYLLDRNTGRGFVIARGTDLNRAYTWLPDPALSGERILGAAIYDQTGNYIAGTVIPVQVQIEPQVTITGAVEGQTISGNLNLGVASNFLAEYVKYEFINHDTGKTWTTDPADPEGPYAWNPEFPDNGKTTITALAYDGLGREYRGQPLTVNVNITKAVSFRGVSNGATITKPVTLWVDRNFPITQVDYILRNPATGTEELLGRYGYVSHYWFPGPDKAGTWELYGIVLDTAGRRYETEPVTVKVSANPLLLVEGVGPNQVITGEIKVKAKANVPVSNITYTLTNNATGAVKTLGSSTTLEGEIPWSPTKGDDGNYSFRAVATATNGQTLQSETIPVRIYTGTIYSAKPIIAKDQFKDFASQLAVGSMQKTGMSAALQTAQAILETGWGQSSPVDKYSGQMSNNLFGIKGKGPAGSVTSNTWEEYNGTTFRVDAAFRAYKSPAESWDDHKSLLLNAARYAPYREVMHNSTQGAWALRRCGYATDSKYPTKLINLIKQHQLYLLDEVTI